MVKPELKYVGRSVPRVDGIEKVTGQAKFLGDLVVPGMLQGKILRSSYPHARILSIDTSKAEALPGVAAVLTAADLGDRVPTYNGRPVIAANRVRYVGEPMAAVAAHPAGTGVIGGLTNDRKGYWAAKRQAARGSFHVTALVHWPVIRFEHDRDRRGPCQWRAADSRRSQ